ncbi:hypothetical protein G6F32_014046 [Rhizopus arrhizus]|nr:hypothetical protein G6F32_014046 [Rhizopus arrhizus]
MVARHDAGQIAIGHAFAQRHRLVQRTDDMRTEKTQRGDQHQGQQAQRHGALAPQRAVKSGVHIVHIQAGEDQPPPVGVICRVTDLRQGLDLAGPRDTVLHNTPARLAPGVQVFKDRQAVDVFDGAHVRAHELGVGVDQQGVIVAEDAHIPVGAVAQLRQPPRHVALGVGQGHALADALLAVAQDAGGQVQDVAQFRLALGHHFGAALPRVPGAQNQNGGADGEHEPQQFPAQAGIFHWLSS